jgi:hypothetical protein
MCCKLVSSPTLSHFSSIILLQVATYYQGPRFNIHDVDVNVVCHFGSILVPFFIIMMVVGGSRRNTHDSDEEIQVDSTYQGEEEGMEGDGDNENDSDGQDPQKSKDRYTPLWKYVTKLSEGKRGGTGKFICHHCHIEYTGSYTHLRKHLCGPMYWDEGKNIGIKACVSIDLNTKGKRR